MSKFKIIIWVGVVAAILFLAFFGTTIAEFISAMVYGFAFSASGYKGM